jgi:hypothetical protein
MVECKVKCEFDGGCRIASLDEQRVNLIHEKTRIAIDVVEGPENLEFIDPKIKEMDQLQKQIDEIVKQIGAQTICSKCPWR